MNELEFTKIYEEYKKYVSVIIRCHIDDKHLQDDLFQEVWISVIRSWHNFKKNSKISTWLYSVTKFTALQYKRKHRYIGKEKCLGDSSWCAGVSPGFEDSLIDWSVLKESINALDDEEQKLIFLKYGMGYRLSELGKELGLTETTVKGRLAMAKKKLRSRLFKK